MEKEVLRITRKSGIGKPAFARSSRVVCRAVALCKSTGKLAVFNQHTHERRHFGEEIMTSANHVNPPYVVGNDLDDVRHLSLIAELVRFRRNLIFLGGKNSSLRPHIQQTGSSGRHDRAVHSVADML